MWQLLIEPQRYLKDMIALCVSKSMYNLLLVGSRTVKMLIFLRRGNKTNWILLNCNRNSNFHMNSITILSIYRFLQNSQLYFIKATKIQNFKINIVSGYVDIKRLYLNKFAQVWDLLLLFAVSVYMAILITN